MKRKGSRLILVVLSFIPIYNHSSIVEISVVDFSIFVSLALFCQLSKDCYIFEER